MFELIDIKSSIGVDPGGAPIAINPSLRVNNEIVSAFLKNPTASMIWMYSLLQSASNPAFIPRREFIKKRFAIGETKLRKEIKFLKDMGLVETVPTYTRGKLTGAEYKFYLFDDAVQNPSPTNTRGPQGKTKAARDKKQPKALSNGDLPDRCKTDYSGQRPEGKKPSIQFQNDDPEEHKRIFLSYFLGQNTFQTFDDSTMKKRELSKIYQTYNSMDIDAKNNKGAGIFLTINETDGKGRSKKNIIRVRAVFADMDGAPLAPVIEFFPSLIVESSPGRYHAYWMTDSVPLDHFTGIQKAIAAKFHSDPKVCDLARVMRIPGYYHCKGDPTLSRVIYTSKNKYSFEELKVMFPVTPPNQACQVNKKALKIQGAYKNNRNDSLCRMIGAMKNKNIPELEIKTKAHEFGKKCVPPLGPNQIETTLRSAGQWNREMQGEK